MNCNQCGRYDMYNNDDFAGSYSTNWNSGEKQISEYRYIHLMRSKLFTAEAKWVESVNWSKIFNLA